MSTNKLKSSSVKLNYSQTNFQKVLVDFLVVAGGGGAGQAPGSSGSYASGGGGAGGLRTSYGPSGGGNGPEAVLSLTKGTTYTVAVGAGGAAGSTPGATNGVNSSISGSDITTISCAGGGAGFYSVQQNSLGLDGVGDGGSGGGMSYFIYIKRFKGFGTVNQGYDGARGDAAGTISGSGGGAGGPGNHNAPGGIGVSSSITGTATYYAGGGAAGSGISHNGGLGGGGAKNTSGTSNTGGGGGGNQGIGSGATSSGAGGSGVVIIRAPQAAVSTTGSPAVSNDGSFTVYRFTGDGSITF